MLALLLMLVGCGDSNSGGSSNGDSASKQELKGARVDTESFSIIVPDNWTSIDISNGIQMYKPSNETIKVTLNEARGNENLAKKKIDVDAERYEGTSPQEIEMLGLTFWVTSFEYAGIEQNFHYTVKDDSLIFIETVKGDYSSPEFAAIIESIEFKYHFTYQCVIF